MHTYIYIYINIYTYIYIYTSCLCECAWVELRSIEPSPAASRPSWPPPKQEFRASLLWGKSVLISCQGDSKFICVNWNLCSSVSPYLRSLSGGVTSFLTAIFLRLSASTCASVSVSGRDEATAEGRVPDEEPDTGAEEETDTAGASGIGASSFSGGSGGGLAVAVAAVAAVVALVAVVVVAGAFAAEVAVELDGG